MLVYTLKILTKLVNFRHLKIGRRSRAREREENRIYQPPTIKDFILPLEDRLNATIVADKRGVTARRFELASGRGPEFRILTDTI